MKCFSTSSAVWNCRLDFTFPKHTCILFVINPAVMRVVEREQCENEKQELKSPALKFETLSDLFQHISMEENTSVQCSLVDAFLHTYRLFSTAEQVLLTADRRFWDICHSDVIPVDTKLKEINCLRTFLSRWLRQPHVKDFDSISGLAELHRFTSIVVGWCRAFQLRSTSTTTTETEKTGQWTSRYIDKSSQTSSATVSSIVFPNLDKRVRERMAYKLEYLSKHAEYRAKVLRSKYYDLDSSGSTGRKANKQSDTQCSLAWQQSSFDGQQNKGFALTGSLTERFSKLGSVSVAEGLTAIDKGLFLNLLLPELLENVRNRPCPTYTATVDQFNRLVNVVQCTVLSVCRDSSTSPKDSLTANRESNGSQESNAPLAVAVWSNRHLQSRHNGETVVSALETFYGEEHKRAEIIAKWINIASHLRQLNNLNSLQAILVALQIGAIRRLRNCWTIVELLYAEQYRRFEALNALMDISENHERVRAYMRKHLETLMKSERARRKNDGTPKESPSTDGLGMIPYLGIFMSDLTFLNTAQPDYITASSSPSSRPDLASKSRFLNSPTISVESRSSSSLSSSGGKTDCGLKSYRRRNSQGPAFRLESHPGVTNVTQVSKPHSPKPTSTREISIIRDDKLINFTKHIREASTLRDIYLLQFSASFYQVKSDPYFQLWFDGFPKLSEAEAMQYSLFIEPGEKDRTAPSVVGAFDRLSSNKATGDIHMWSSSRALSITSCPSANGRIRGCAPNVLARSSRVPPSSGSQINSTFTSSVDSPNRSSSDVDSTYSSQASKYSTKSRFRSASRKRQFTCDLLDIPKTQRGRSSTGFQSAYSTSNSDCESPDLTIHVTLQETEQLPIPDRSSVLKHVAKLGSTPNLASSHKTSTSFVECPTVVEKVSSTDRISDLLIRVIGKFALPLENMSQYNLAVVRPGLPDRILSIEDNAMRAFRQNQLVQPNMAVKCALVRHQASRSTINIGRLRRASHPKATMKYCTYRARSSIRQPSHTIFDLWSTRT